MSQLKKLIHPLSACIVCIALFVMPSLASEEHVVTAGELHQALAASAQSARKNRSEITRFFASNRVAHALKTAKIDPVQIQKAVPFLTDQEAARLSARVQKVQNDFAAGSLTNQQLTYIVIALATAVIVILIVEK